VNISEKLFAVRMNDAPTSSDKRALKRVYLAGMHSPPDRAKLAFPSYLRILVLSSEYFSERLHGGSARHRPRLSRRIFPGSPSVAIV
jgi:hypothetical protein